MHGADPRSDTTSHQAGSGLTPIPSLRSEPRRHSARAVRSVPGLLAALLTACQATPDNREASASEVAPSPSDAAREVLLAATRGDEGLTVLDPGTLTPLATIDLGLGAHELALAPDGRLVVGAAYGGPGANHQPPDQRLAVVDLASGAVLHVLDLGGHVRPNDAVFLPDSRRVLVTSEVRGALLVVDAVAGSIERVVELGETYGHMVCLAPDAPAEGRAGLAFVPHAVSGRVSVVDVGLGRVLGQVETAPGAEGIACTRDGSSVWCASNHAGRVTVFDGRTREVLATLDVPGFPFRIEFDGAEQRAVACCPEANDLAVFDVATRTLVRRIALDAASPQAVPIAVAVARDGSRAFVNCAGTNEIVAVDLTTGALLARHAAGPMLDPLTIGPRG
jgi:DNA-binding beta-propeller fold protein YncE